MTQVITRSVEVRSVDLEERTITGLAVPYGQVVDIPAEGIKESFVRGVFEGSTDVKLFNEHREIIGRVISGDDTDQGYEITAKVSNTRAGNDVYELLKDEALKNFSVGFIPVEDRDEDGVVVRAKALLKEVSVVAFPAYSGAQISQVRTGEEINQKEDTNMSDEIKEVLNRVANLESANEELERRIAVAGEAPAKGEVQFRNGGDFLKALAKGDDSAKAVVRYTGATSADSHTGNDWKAGLLRIVNNGRPVLNLFSKGPLGPTGNTIEYPKVSATTGDVAVQVAEGDDLAYLEVAITTATAPVKTYGGYSQLTRQAIERSDVPYLAKVLEFQAASYAKVTNAAVRTAVTGATPQTGTSFTLATAKGADFLNAVIDGIAKLEDNGVGAVAEFILVSRDVYARLGALADSTDRPLFNITGDGTNTPGSLNVRGLAGSLAGLPVIVDAGLAAKTMYVASSEAVTSWENSGAPVRLDDENVINLSKNFSLFGYMAVGVTNANGLVKPTIA
jgi:hypothetical protein